jgi:hypothetical protein
LVMGTNLLRRPAKPLGPLTTGRPSHLAPLPSLDRYNFVSPVRQPIQLAHCLLLYFVSPVRQIAFGVLPSSAWPSPDLIIAGHQQLTKEWWRTRRNEFELCI